eukprot:TRINITY_DN61062_c0_g1_i1.p1 TRINITY_DN61062_c0_g1~~TRINITY_DN61062_c0_g1_i1.p1  ORF type:complete len:206 (-),score=35.25 TRINITY_DN61062_c0_g1_i1:210-827(-)
MAKELFYIANIIDYFRFVTLYLACTSENPWYFVGWYGFSYLLDCLDGPAARAFGQESKLGYYLDMICDRVSSCVCLHFAAQAVLADNHSVTAPLKLPIVAILYSSLILVEIVAHGVVMYLSEVVGMHQKKMGFDYTAVKLYLGDRKLLFWGCVSFEMVGLALIVDVPLAVFLGLPGFVFRAVANLCRLLAIFNMPSWAPSDDKTT